MRIIKSVFSVHYRERLFSIVAFGVYLFALQIVFFPFSASRLSAEDFSYLVLVFILGSICSSVFGNELGNLRFTTDERYFPLKQLLIRGFVGVSICLCALIVVFGSTNNLLPMHLLSSVYIGFATIKFYLFSYPREWKRFDFIFVVQFLFASILCLSLTINLNSVTHFLVWLVLSEVIAIILLIVLRALFNPNSNDRSKPITSKEMNSASLYALLQNITLYLDRLIIPLLWPPAVLSYYFSASALSKLPIALSNPIAQVILSEKVRGRENVGPLPFKSLLLLFFLLLPTTYAFTHVLTYLLYNDYYQSAKDLILYLSIFSSALFISNLLAPIYQANQRYGVLSIFNIGFIVSFCVIAMAIHLTSGNVVHLSILLSVLVVARTIAYIFFAERKNASQ